MNNKILNVQGRLKFICPARFPENELGNLPPFFVCIVADCLLGKRALPVNQIMKRRVTLCETQFCWQWQQ